MRTWQTILCLLILGASVAATPAKEPSPNAKHKASSATDPKTGVTFPKQVASFTRQGPIEYDDEGYPNASYTTKSLIFASVFYYKGEPFPMEYAKAREAVKEGSWHAKLAFDRSTTLRPSGRHSMFSFVRKVKGGYIPFITDLMMFPHHGYCLKFRITHPADVGDQAVSEIVAFVRDFPLP